MIFRKLTTILALAALALAPQAHGDFFESKGALIHSTTSTATAAGTTTLTYQSNSHQRFTGVTTQNCDLPAATTLRVGREFRITNDSTGVVTVRNNGGSTVDTVPAGRTYRFLLTDNGTANGTWTVHTPVSEGTVVDADVAAAASIARTKVASGTASHVVINDGSGVLSSEATLSKARGGFGADVSALTMPTAGTILSSTPSQYGVLVSGSGSTTTVLGTGTSGQVLTSAGAGANPSFQDPADAPSASYEISNLGIATSVAANALTISLKGADGNDPSGSNVVRVGFRNATAATGTYSQVAITSALSLTISSGSTLGHVSAVAAYLCVYLINNAGTAELAASTRCNHDEGSVLTTTAEGGAGAADSRTVIYSTTARSNVPARLVARILSTQATAGTWASAMTEVALWPFRNSNVLGTNGLPIRLEAAAIVCTAGSTVTSEMTGDWISAIGNAGGGGCDITIATGTFNAAPYCWASHNSAMSTGIILSMVVTSATAITIDCETDASAECSSYGALVFCMGLR